MAVKAEQLSLEFVATDDGRIRGVSNLYSSAITVQHSLLQYDISGTLPLGIDSSFYIQLVSELVSGPVSSAIRQLVWQEGQNYITAATTDTVS